MSNNDARIREHYLIEKELAARLRRATKEERRRLYTEVYDELFQRVPDHPQLALKHDEAARRRHVTERLAVLEPYLNSETTYLELGPGDCALAVEIAQRVQKVYAVDVSREIVRNVVLTRNMELVISDGCSIPVPDASVDVVYSDQLMEHLHPEDAAEQLQNIYRALKTGGTYVCITPNRLSGPHDVSQYFDEVATGFHLQEYTAAELAEMFRAAGFARIEARVGARNFHFASPLAMVTLTESMLTALPRPLGRTLARGLPLRLVLGIKMIATK